MIFKRIQLGLIHVAVAMTLVPINSTLNRVMIKELAISASLVAILASLPYLFAPIQVAIGSFSDRHPLLGYRRTPYIALGLFLCVLGVIVSPHAAMLIPVSPIIGLVLGVAAFGAWGMGFNFATVSYLSLASELSGEKGRGKTIAVMWFMMIASIIVTAISLSQMVDPYTPQALQRAFWVVGLFAFLLGALGLFKLEKRDSKDELPKSDAYSWRFLILTVLANKQAKLFFWYLTILLAAILGQDILLEPFGGEAFGLSVTQTTRITSLWGSCVLIALVIAGMLENRISTRSLVQWGAWGALTGIVLIGVSGIASSLELFYAGVVLLGIGTGLSTVSNLSLMLEMTTAEMVGLFMGAWGMSNAISRLVGSILGGVVRDLVAQVAQNPVLGYVVVFGIEALMLAVSLVLLKRIDVNAFREQSQSHSLVERVAIASEA